VYLRRSYLANALPHPIHERRRHQGRLRLEGALANDLDQLPLPVLLELEHAPRLPILRAPRAARPLLGDEGAIVAAQRAHLAVQLAPRPVLVRPQFPAGAALEQPERPDPRRVERRRVGAREALRRLGRRRTEQRFLGSPPASGASDRELLHQELLGNLVASVPESPVQPHPDPGLRARSPRSRHRRDQPRHLAVRAPEEEDALRHGRVHLGAARRPPRRRRDQPDALHAQRGLQLPGKRRLPDHSVP